MSSKQYFEDVAQQWDTMRKSFFSDSVREKAFVVAGLARILKPGGKLVISDLDEHSFGFLRAEQHHRWLGFKREDARRWFEQAGLQGVAVDCVGENCCASSGCGCQQARVSIVVVSGQKA